MKHKFSIILLVILSFALVPLLGSQFLKNETRSSGMDGIQPLFGTWRWIALDGFGAIVDKGNCFPAAESLTISPNDQIMREKSRPHSLSLTAGTDQRPDKNIFSVTIAVSGKPIGYYHYDAEIAPRPIIRVTYFGDTSNIIEAWSKCG